MLQRGDIVIADFGRDARGREIGHKQTGSRGVRWAVVVSSSPFNNSRSRASVVPIMNYDTEGRELAVNWGFWLPKYSVSVGGIREDESFVDCGQVWTLFSTQTTKVSQPNDIRKCTGKLLDRIRLDLALQIVFNPYILVPDALWRDRFRTVPKYGDVITLQLPSAIPGKTTEEKQALVISSLGVDSIREQVHLSHISVVPLEHAGNFSEDHSGHGVALVDVFVEDPIQLMANCQEIYTIDWKQRTVRIVGSVCSAQSMDMVMIALRRYLDLPMPIGPDITKSKLGSTAFTDHHSPWASISRQLSAAAEHYSTLSAESGLAYHTSQQEAADGFFGGINSEFSTAVVNLESPVSNKRGEQLIEKIDNTVRLWFGYLSTLLLEPAPAGSIRKFPEAQSLPSDWFSGRNVRLLFKQDVGGTWLVMRTGTLHELKLTFWSVAGEMLGQPIMVGGVPEPIPVDSPNKLSRIDIEDVGV